MSRACCFARFCNSSIYFRDKNEGLVVVNMKTYLCIKHWNHLHPEMNNEIAVKLRSYKGTFAAWIEFGFLGHVSRRSLCHIQRKPFMNLNGNYEFIHPFKTVPKLWFILNNFHSHFRKRCSFRRCWKNAQSWFCTKLCSLSHYWVRASTDQSSFLQFVWNL